MREVPSENRDRAMAERTRKMIISLGVYFGTLAIPLTDYGRAQFERRATSVLNCVFQPYGYKGPDDDLRADEDRGYTGELPHERHKQNLDMFVEQMLMLQGYIPEIAKVTLERHEVIGKRYVQVRKDAVVIDALELMFTCDE